MAVQRSTAYKVWISDIVGSNYIKQEGFNPNYVELDGKQVSRVNLIATVVGKFMSDDGNYGALTLDDGTETIRIKAFGPDVSRIKNAEIGRLVRAVGKIKEYNEERYLAPDFVTQIDDPNWLIVQKLELGEPKERAAQEAPAVDEPIKTGVEEETESVSYNDIPNFIELIAKLDSGDGADMDAVITESKLDTDDAKNVIVGLLKDGEIYEPRKGKLKVL